MSLLEIRGLRTHLTVLDGTARAVDGVDLTVGQGETVGVVGESGSGKTVLALSILGLLPDGEGGILPGSSIRFRGEELVGMKKGRLREIRGGEIAMVFQEPMTSLNPVFTVGSQIREAVELHRGLKGRNAVEETLRLMSDVGIPEPEARMASYPHQFSGGMRQRVMIAMALAGEPSVLIADEPTTALDVTTESQILGLLSDLQARLEMALLFISHDLGVVSRVCDRVVILYGGRVVEVGPTREILASPKHPYTRGLMGSRLAIDDRRSALRPIAGEVPEATDWPQGCRFHPRCPEVLSRCRRTEPGFFPSGNGGAREVRCWLFEEEGGES
ncbi:MAG: ABC transporter ATP-binding protein [Gemmatimonadota bacterium]|jgi:oligopeptide/dipeptide ABC transporter ATP-binding protein